MQRLLALPSAARVLAVLLGAALAALAMGGIFGTSSLDEAEATHGSSSIHRCNNGLMGQVKPCAAKGWFVKRGDVIVVNDTRRDGYGAIIDWYVQGTNIEGTLRDKSGADGRPAYSNRNLPEGRLFRFRVCASNGANPISGSCSRYYSTRI